ncbi:MAG: hypothetical protein JW881_14430 [Spirochaetales bacterium]|nr:hypothetical protein [Spirochaetales bacterium]
MKANIVLLATWLLFSALVCFCAEGPENGIAERKICVFDLQQIGDRSAKDAEIFGSVIKKTLVFELKVAGFTVLDDALWKQKQRSEGIRNDDLIEGNAVFKLGEMIQANVVISGFFTIEDERILFGIKCYDLWSKRLAVSVLKSGRAGVSATSLINSAVEEIIPKIKKELESYTVSEGTVSKEVVVYEDVTFKEMQEMGKRIAVTLKSVDEDAYIFLADTYIGRITDGECLIETKANSTLHIGMIKEGYHMSDLEIGLEDEDAEIHVKKLAKKTVFATDIQYTFFQFLGAGLGIRYYIIPDWFFLHANNYFYMQAGYQPGSWSIFHNDLNFILGGYVYFPPDFIFRVSLYTGLGFVFSFHTAPDFPVYTSYYWDILGGFVELNLEDIIIYVKEGGRFYQDIFSNSLRPDGWNRPWAVTLSIGVMMKW